MTDLYKIKSEACKFFQIDPTSFDCKLQTREIVKVRYIAMAVAKRNTKYSLTEIGSIMAGKNHSTVTHADKTVSNLCETDKDYAQEFKDFENRIKILLKNRNINTIKASVILKDSQFQGSGYYFTYKGKNNLSLEKVVKISANSISDIETNLNLNEIERIEIDIISKPTMKINSMYVAVNEPIEIEI